MLDLAGEIADGLTLRGLRVLSSRERSRQSGNTCFAAHDARAVMHQLAARGVLVWGEYGRVRVSGHLYNGSRDVERLWQALEEIAV